MIIKIISRNKKMAEVVIKTEIGKRENGTKKYSSVTKHITLEELKQIAKSNIIEYYDEQSNSTNKT